MVPCIAVRLVVGGLSAGGQLAAMTALEAGEEIGLAGTVQSGPWTPLVLRVIALRASAPEPCSGPGLHCRMAEDSRNRFPHSSPTEKSRGERH